MKSEYPRFNVFVTAYAEEDELGEYTWIPCEREYLDVGLFDFGCGDYGAFLFIQGKGAVRLAPGTVRFRVEPIGYIKEIK